MLNYSYGLNMVITKIKEFNMNHILEKLLCFNQAVAHLYLLEHNILLEYVKA